MPFQLIERVEGSKAGKAGPPKVTISANGQVRLSSAIGAKIPQGSKCAVLWVDRNKKGDVQALAISVHSTPPMVDGRQVTAFPLVPPKKFSQWHFSAGPTLRSIGFPMDVYFDNVSANGEYVAIVQLKDAKPIVHTPRRKRADEDEIEDVEVDDATEEG